MQAWASRPSGPEARDGRFAAGPPCFKRARRPRSQGPVPPFWSFPTRSKPSPGRCHAQRTIDRRDHSWLHHGRGTDETVPRRPRPRPDVPPRMALRPLQRAIHRAAVARREAPRQPGAGRARVLPDARRRRSERRGDRCRTRASPAFAGPDARMAALGCPLPGKRRPRRATPRLRPTRFRERCVAQQLGIEDPAVDVQRQRIRGLPPDAAPAQEASQLGTWREL